MSESLAEITRLPPIGMATLRGDLAAPGLAAASDALVGQPCPGQRQILWSGEEGVAWMGPDELLFFIDPARLPAALDAARAALGSIPHLLADVSDARARFAVTGPAAAHVLAKGTPADLHADVFAPGEIRRTRLGQVAVALWRAPEGDGFQVITFRSVADFVEDWLRNAARPGGAVSAG